MLMGDDKIHDDHHTCAEDDNYWWVGGFQFKFLSLISGCYFSAHT